MPVTGTTYDNKAIKQISWCAIYNPSLVLHRHAGNLVLVSGSCLVPIKTGACQVLVAHVLPTSWLSDTRVLYWASYAVYLEPELTLETGESFILFKDFSITVRTRACVHFQFYDFRFLSLEFLLKLVSENTSRLSYLLFQPNCLLYYRSFFLYRFYFLSMCCELLFETECCASKYKDIIRRET